MSKRSRICPEAAGRTYPEAARREPYLRPLAQFFPIRAALGRQIKVYIFFHGIAVKVPKMSEILVKIIKLTFAIIALVIGIHNCLTLPKIHINA